ncbi:MAG TPA: hypothetical protein PLU30_18730 [Verrucomicrobiae bacterium]|nr:hypothetical protein [Verrucomicrobiae bacterium]
MDVVDHNALLLQLLLGWTAVAAFLAILVVHRTALLGFTMWAAFNVLMASHSALLWSSLFGLDFAWVSHEHIQVFQYVGFGLLLYAIGVFIAWKPLRQSAAADPSGQKNPISGERLPPWLTPQFVLLCMWIGAAGYLLTPITSVIPTVHAIWTIFFDWLNVGILIAGFYSSVTRRYKVVLVSLAVFLPLGLIRVVSDGHAGALGLFLVQFGLVFLMSRRVRLQHMIALGLLFLFMGPLASTWFKVRGFIREGAIQGNPIQRVMTFIDLFGIYYNPFRIDPYELREVLFLRFDMSEIYAAQVRWQPTNEPYAYGRTLTENLLVVLVPRILWPDKPIKFGGAQFISRFTGLYQDSEEGSVSVNTPINLEFYANFGPIGASLLLGVFGYACARLEVALFRRDLRDITKLLRQFVFCMVLCTTGSNLALTVMKLVPGLVGIWIASKVIENLRKTMRFNKDFLTPLDPKKKAFRVIVTGEVHEPAVAGAMAGAGGAVAAPRMLAGVRPASTFSVQKVPPYGFRRWDGPRGK